MDNETYGLLVGIIIIGFLIGTPLLIYYLGEIRPKRERDKMIRELFTIYKIKLDSGIPREKSAVYDKIKNIRI